MRINVPATRAMAEKTFGRKAHPDASLSPKAFLKKKLGIGKPKQDSPDQVFRKSAGVGNEGMYHSGVNNNALVPMANPKMLLLKKKK